MSSGGFFPAGKSEPICTPPEMMVYSAAEGNETIMLDRLKKYLMRRQRPVSFRDPLRTVPASRGFGAANGTPVDRYYIERFLAENRSSIRGVVGEIAENLYTGKFGAKDVRSLVFNFDRKAASDLTGDLSRPETLPEELFDCFICTQTLNFIFDVPAAVSGLARMLKPGGVLLGSVAGISQISRFDYERWGDYWRFTDLSLRRLLEREFAEVETECFGNVAAATAFLDGVVVEQLPDQSVLDAADGDYQLLIGFRAVRPERGAAL